MQIGKGLYACEDCGKICIRKNSKQKRCEPCQEIHAKLLKKYAAANKRLKERERKNERIQILLARPDERMSTKVV